MSGYLLICFSPTAIAFKSSLIVQVSGQNFLICFLGSICQSTCSRITTGMAKFVLTSTGVQIEDMQSQVPIFVWLCRLCTSLNFLKGLP